MIQKRSAAEDHHLRTPRSRPTTTRIRRNSPSARNSFKLAQILIAVPPNASPDQIAAARAKAESIRKQAARRRRLRRAGARVLRRRFQEPGWRTGRLFARRHDRLHRRTRSTTCRWEKFPSRWSHQPRLPYPQARGARQAGSQTARPRSSARSGKAGRPEGRATVQHWVDKDLVKQHYVETFN